MAWACMWEVLHWPTVSSVCHHVTHLSGFFFSTCHLGNFHPFIFYTCFLLQSELLGVCWSPIPVVTGQKQGDAMGKLPVCYRGHNESQTLTDTREQLEKFFANHRNLFYVEIILGKKTETFAQPVTVSEKSSAPQQFGDSREATNHSTGFNCLNPTHVSGQIWINSAELWGSVETEFFFFPVK